MNLCTRCNHDIGRHEQVQIAMSNIKEKGLIVHVCDCGCVTDLHHAYCIIGSKNEIIKELENFFKKELQFDIVANPDFWYGEYDSMDVEDARSLKELHLNKPTAGDRKIFVVSANFITEKAQNAMLKMFEEPAGGTHFFLIMPSSEALIPTLKSRLIFITHAADSSANIFAKKFFTLSPAERLEKIKILLEEISDEEKSKAEAVKLVNALEKELSERIPVSKDPALFESVERVRQYAHDPAPSLKMLLEYLAIILPVQEK